MGYLYYNKRSVKTGCKMWGRRYMEFKKDPIQYQHLSEDMLFKILQKYVNDRQLTVNDFQLHDICKTHYSARSVIKALDHLINKK